MSNEHLDSLGPVVIAGDNLSVVWGQALIHLNDNAGSKVAPLILSLNEIEAHAAVPESNGIRTALDGFLHSRRNAGCFPVKSVAFTIFPQGFWLISNGQREKLYEIYNDALPHIKARHPALNNRGLYFERMISFKGARTNENQLEYMFGEFAAGRNRASIFQVTIFDPTVDQHTGPYQTFPCLQNVNFVLTDDGLILNAFYAMQYLVRRCYGNLLGLCHLGAFVADAMGVPIIQLNMMAGTEKLDFSKRDVSNLVETVRPHIQS